MLGLEKLEGKATFFLGSALFLVLAGIGLFAWGHHSGSVLTSAEDAKKLNTCTIQNAALAEAVKADAATIKGLKAANVQAADAANANADDLRKTVATLTQQLAQQKADFADRNKKLEGVKHGDKKAGAWGDPPIPDSLLDIMR